MNSSRHQKEISEPLEKWISDLVEVPFYEGVIYGLDNGTMYIEASFQILKQYREGRAL